MPHLSDLIFSLNTNSGYIFYSGPEKYSTFIFLLIFETNKNLHNRLMKENTIKHKINEKQHTMRHKIQ